MTSKKRVVCSAEKACIYLELHRALRPWVGARLRNTHARCRAMITVKRAPSVLWSTIAKRDINDSSILGQFWVLLICNSELIVYREEVIVSSFVYFILQIAKKYTLLDSCFVLQFIACQTLYYCRCIKNVNRKIQSSLCRTNVVPVKKDILFSKVKKNLTYGLLAKCEVSLVCIFNK